MGEQTGEVSTSGFVDTRGRARKRNKPWPEAVKRQIVAETRMPGASASVVARRHDVNSNQVFKLATVGIVVVFVVFILLYREDLRDRIDPRGRHRDLHRTIAVMNDAAPRLSRYFLVQVGINTADRLPGRARAPRRSSAIYRCAAWQSASVNAAPANVPAHARG